jgi:hypothetical protein
MPLPDLLTDHADDAVRPTRLSLEDVDDRLVEILSTLHAHRDALPDLSNLEIVLEDPDVVLTVDPTTLADVFTHAGHIELSGYPSFDAQFAALSEQGAFTGVIGLTVPGSQLTDDAVEAFLDAGPYPRLTHLSFVANKLRRRTGELLGGTDALPSLTHLRLTKNPLGGPGVKALVTGPGVQGLTWLDLASTKPGKAGLTAVLCGNVLPELTELDLGYTPAKPADWAKILGAARHPKLRVLNLGAGLDPGYELEADPFVTAELPALEELDIHGLTTREIALQIAAGVPHLPSLSAVTLSTPDVQVETLTVPR